MKTFAIALGLMASVSSFAGVIYSNTADLSTGTRSFKLDSAEYKLVATKTEIRQIPNCNMEANYPCTEEVALERAPVVYVNVSYVDPSLQTEGYSNSWIGFNFRTEDFAAADVAALQAASPAWKHPFSRAGVKFAKANLTLSVVKAERTIQVVDVRNSKLCRILESGEQEPNCVEHIVYKPAQTFVNQVTVSKK